MDVELTRVLALLDPISAVCAYAVVTSRITPHIIHLAQESVLWDTYTWVRMLGGGNPNPSVCHSLRDMVLEEMQEEMFFKLSGYWALPLAE